MKLKIKCSVTQKDILGNWTCNLGCKLSLQVCNFYETTVTHRRRTGS
jgi:hypothetical protein